MKTTKRLLTYILPYKHYLLLAVLSALISVSTMLYAPILIGQAIDCIIDTGSVDFTAMVQILLHLCLVLLCSALFQKLLVLATKIGRAHV